MATKSKPLVTTTEKTLIITGTIFCISMIEGLVQYSFAEAKSENKSFWDAWATLPDTKDLLKMGAVVLVVSSITGGAVSVIENQIRVRRSK
jgi:hypothetical protein